MKTKFKFSWQLTVLAVFATVSLYTLASRTQPFVNIDVGGHSVRVLKLGDGSPTIVFENGAGATLETWTKIQPAVSKFATTVSYDRANTGRSDDGPLPRDAFQVARELQIVLRSVRAEPPIILVGHSRGGLFAQVYASVFADEVSALVLVDPAIASGDYLEEGEVNSGGPEFDAYPLISKQVSENVVPQEIPIFLIAAEGNLENPFLALVNEEGRLEYRNGTLKKMVYYENWLQDKPNGQLIVLANTGHFINREKPTAVISAITEAARITSN